MFSLCVLRIAAVDIGSNAVRFLISEAIEASHEVRFKQVAYLRFPLKLGKDVFGTGLISLQSQRKLFQLLRTFKLLKELYEVAHWRICATAAFREADNKQDVIAYIQSTLGLNLEVIDGQQEASLIAQAIGQILTQKKYFFHADVGGGSTELSFYVKGTLVGSRSFEMGAVRMLEGHHRADVWDCARRWIQRQAADLRRPPYGVATGGGIRKMAQIMGCSSKDALTLKHLQQALQQLLDNGAGTAPLSAADKDVIVSSVQIYSAVMEWAGVEKLLAPNAGLKEGIIRALYKSIRNGSSTA